MAATSIYIDETIGDMNGPIGYWGPAATAGRVTIAEVERLVAPGGIDADHVVTPGIFVQWIFQGTHYEKRIEQRTHRPKSSARA